MRKPLLLRQITKFRDNSVLKQNFSRNQAKELLVEYEEVRYTGNWTFPFVYLCFLREVLGMFYRQIFNFYSRQLFICPLSRIMKNA